VILLLFPTTDECRPAPALSVVVTPSIDAPTTSMSCGECHVLGLGTPSSWPTSEHGNCGAHTPAAPGEAEALALPQLRPGPRPEWSSCQRRSRRLLPRREAGRTVCSADSGSSGRAAGAAGLLLQECRGRRSASAPSPAARPAQAGSDGRGCLRGSARAWRGRPGRKHPRPTTIRAAGETCQASRSEATRKGIAWVVELTLRAGLQPQEPESHRSAIAPRRGVRGHDRDPRA
jgi:hypothetical protein